MKREGAAPPHNMTGRTDALMDEDGAKASMEVLSLQSNQCPE